MGVRVMNTEGVVTLLRSVPYNPRCSTFVAWSPECSTLAFSGPSGSDPYNDPTEIYVIDAYDPVRRT